MVAVTAGWALGAANPPLLLLLLLLYKLALLVQLMLRRAGGRGEGRAAQGAAADGLQLLPLLPPARLQTPLLLP
jgi:hypothetical protein